MFYRKVCPIEQKASGDARKPDYFLSGVALKFQGFLFYFCEQWARCRACEAKLVL